MSCCHPGDKGPYDSFEVADVSRKAPSGVSVEKIEQALRNRIVSQLENKISEYEFLAQASNSSNSEMSVVAHSLRIARSVVLNEGVPHEKRVEDKDPRKLATDIGEI